MASKLSDALTDNAMLGDGKQTTSDSSTLPFVLSDGVNAVNGGVNSLSDILNKASMKVSSLDCPDIVYTWLKETKPFSYVVWFVGGGIELLKKANATISGESIKAFVQSSSVAGAICAVIANIYAVINEVINIGLKLAFVLFDLIDDARLRLDAALKSLTNAVMNCIMNVYDMIKQFLCDIAKLGLVIDWNGLEMFMSACPCICRFIAHLMGCDKDDDGNDISMQASAVIRCIREKFPFLDAMTVGAAISKLMTNFLKKYLLFLFDLVNNCIDILFNLLIIPLRALIKKYIKLLRNKWDMSFLINGLKTVGLDCLLTYTTEVDDSGSEYYGMSILDMIASISSWVSCLEYPCASLSEQIKNKVKKYNKDLRLDSEFWNREFECDLYAICMRMENVGPSDLDEFWDGMTKKWNTMFDSLKTKKFDVMHCVADYDDSSYDDIAAAMEEVMEATGAVDADVGNPVKNASRKENWLSNGHVPLTRHEDSVIHKMGKNIFDSCKDGDYFFNELWNQYIRFISRYRLHDESFKDICSKADNINNLRGTFTGSSTTQFIQYTNRRVALTFTDEPRRVNYYWTSDYSQSRADSILSKEMAARGENETLVSYCARIYAGTV